MTARKEPGKGTVWVYTDDRPVRLPVRFGYRKVVKGDTLTAVSVPDARWLADNGFTQKKPPAKPKPKKTTTTTAAPKPTAKPTTKKAPAQPKPTKAKGE